MDAMELRPTRAVLLGIFTKPQKKRLRQFSFLRRKISPGRMCLARHRDFAQFADPAGLARLGHYAVDQLGRPYDHYEIARIAARITMSQLCQPTECQDLLEAWSEAGPERDRAFICSEYVWECYRSLGLELAHDARGFIAPKDFAAAEAIECLATLRPSL